MVNNKLLEIISSNQGLKEDIQQSDFLKNNLVGILRNIESTIPEKCRDNFYKNIETLRISGSRDGSYCLVDATVINLDKKLLFVVDNNIKSNSGNDFSDALAMELYHELLHLSSNTIQIIDGKVKGNGGFQNIYKQENGEIKYGKEDELNGLNEGFTQYLTLLAFNKDIDTSKYDKQIAAIKNLIDLVGFDVLKEVYFDNREGMEPIKRILEEKNISPEFYRQLEEQCHVKNIEILSDLQSKTNTEEHITEYDITNQENKNKEELIKDEETIS